VQCNCVVGSAVTVSKAVSDRKYGDDSLLLTKDVVKTVKQV